MNKVIAMLFAIACYATAALSQKAMGVGMWFWIIIISGTVVVISQYIVVLKALGALLATLLGVLSVIAVVMVFLAANVGGSFRMDEQTAVLLGGFFMIALLGFIHGYMYQKSRRTFHA